MYICIPNSRVIARIGFLFIQYMYGARPLFTFVTSFPSETYLKFQYEEGGKTSRVGGGKVGLRRKTRDARRSIVYGALTQVAGIFPLAGKFIWVRWNDDGMNVFIFVGETGTAKLFRKIESSGYLSFHPLDMCIRNWIVFLGGGVVGNNCVVFSRIWCIMKSVFVG